jgi:hypothetical protein
MKYLLITLSLLLGGCASSSPKYRVIDATNKQPWIKRSVEKGTSKEDHKDKRDDNGEVIKHKEKETSKKVSWDFSF